METKSYISKQDHTKKIMIIDGYEVVASFSEAQRPDTFQTVRRILLSSSLEKKAIDAA